MSGPNGFVSQNDVRGRVRDAVRAGEQFKSPDNNQVALLRRIGDDNQDVRFTSFLASIFNDNKALSERTKLEVAESFAKDSPFFNQSSARANSKLGAAKGEVAAGAGSEFARVLREKFVKSANETPGRRQTVLTGRI